MRVLPILWLSLLVVGCAGAPPRGPVALFNGQDLTGWVADQRDVKTKPDLPASFVVEAGVLVSKGVPLGHLVTKASFRDYRLVVQWRWPGKPGNCGVLVHCHPDCHTDMAKMHKLYKMFPQSIECQLHVDNAGDFWCIGEDIKVPAMATRRSGKPETWGGEQGQSRRIRNLTDGSEKPRGEWNEMVIECNGNSIDVWVNGDHVNDGFDCTTDHGCIAIQAEGARCEFRKVELTPLAPR